MAFGWLSPSFLNVETFELRVATRRGLRCAFYKETLVVRIILRLVLLVSVVLAAQGCGNSTKGTNNEVLPSKEEQKQEKPKAPPM